MVKSSFPKLLFFRKGTKKASSNDCIVQEQIETNISL